MSRMRARTRRQYGPELRQYRLERQDAPRQRVAARFDRFREQVSQREALRVGQVKQQVRR